MSPLSASDSDTAAATAWARDGFLIVPHLIDPSECAALKAEAARTMREHAGPESTVLVGLSALSAAFRDLHADERILRHLRPVMPDGIAFLSDKAVFKSGAKRFATPWHIDAWYWERTRPKLSVWIALDEARPDNGCLTAVRGSHRRAWPHLAVPGGAANGEFTNVVERDAWDAADQLTVALPQGGALIFSDRTLHGSTVNTSGDDRWSAILTYHAPAEPEEAFDLSFPARRVLER